MTVEKAKALLEMEQDLVRQIGARALTPEARLVLLLMSEGPMPIKRAMIESDLSYRGFYNMIDRLISRGTLVREPSQQDRRIQLLRLTAGLQAT
ncbi:MAG: hypothetical protein RLZZ415_1828 [Pseudomonadota bacterium]|jgi:DNA-binding MarR family transcriptional regulator